MFVNSGANLNFVDPDGRSPLYAAIVGRNCSLQDIRQLVRWGADVNLHRDGKLPLFASLYCMGTEVGLNLCHVVKDSFIVCVYVLGVMLWKVFKAIVS